MLSSAEDMLISAEEMLSSKRLADWDVREVGPDSISTDLCCYRYARKSSARGEILSQLPNSTLAVVYCFANVSRFSEYGSIFSGESTCKLSYVDTKENQ